MRPPPASHNILHLSSPPYPPVLQCQQRGGCRWWPYSTSNDFEANAFFILFVLFVALIIALSIYASIRCFLRRNTHHQKPAASATKAFIFGAQAMVFATGMKFAGEEAECAICLSDFAEGEEVTVLENCRHGFHAQCIETWLASRDSCPTCRRSCVVEPPSSMPESKASGDRQSQGNIEA